MLHAINRYTDPELKNKSVGFKILKQFIDKGAEKLGFTEPKGLAR